ncbi:YIP1 family protein [Candidatus Woesearchaeota archaeon]|nr:YIP1 family protein [Candidatus Woesearchaeota archaeon]
MKNYPEQIKNSLHMLVFNDKALDKVVKNKKSTEYAFLTIIIAGLAVALGTRQFSGVIVYPLSLILELIIIYPIFHFIAKHILKGKATGVQYFRAIGNAFIVYWFAFIPILEISQTIRFLASLWLVVVNIYILHKVHKLPKLAAIILGLVPIIIIGLFTIPFV